MMELIPISSASRAVEHVAGTEFLATRAEVAAAQPLAISTLVALLKDESVSAFGTPIVSARVKADTAFRLLALAGHVAPKAPEAKGAEIPLHEMSIEELRALSTELGAEIAERATPVSAANATPDDAKGIDSLM